MSTDKPHWRTVIKRMDTDYLYAEDLGRAGTTVDVEITSSGVGKVKNPGGAKEILWIAFAGRQKKLGLNATMAKVLESMSGSDHWGDWRGWITLVVVHKDKMRDPTTDGGTSPMDVIRIAPQRPEPPDNRGLAARFDACPDERSFAALDAEMRADWSRIPAADRPATTAAFKRADARIKASPAAAAATSSPTTSPDATEQAEILRKEASEVT